MKARAVVSVAVLALLTGGGLPPAASQEGPVVTSLTLFAGTPSGLWRSTNWGGRWERVSGRPAGVTLAEVGGVHGILAVGRGVYLAADAGLFVSDDFGETWKKLGFEVPVLFVLPSRYPKSDPTVFAGAADGHLPRCALDSAGSPYPCTAPAPRWARLASGHPALPASQRILARSEDVGPGKFTVRGRRG